jgi:hypothetical protein
MSLWDAIKALFAPADLAPPDARRLNAANEATLSRDLRAFPIGERGWITIAEAAKLFSSAHSEAAFGEMDDEGKSNLAAFAAAGEAKFEFWPTEGRLYFSRSG